MLSMVCVYDVEQQHVLVSSFLRACSLTMRRRRRADSVGVHCKPVHAGAMGRTRLVCCVNVYNEWTGNGMEQKFLTTLQYQQP